MVLSKLPPQTPTPRRHEMRRIVVNRSWKACCDEGEPDSILKTTSAIECSDLLQGAYFRFAFVYDLHQYVAEVESAIVRTAAERCTMKKKLIALALGILAGSGLTVPVAAAQDGGGLGGIFEGLYAAVAGWLGGEAEEPMLSILGGDSQKVGPLTMPGGAPGKSTPALANGEPNPPGTSEASPMTMPGG